MSDSVQATLGDSTAGDLPVRDANRLQVKERADNVPEQLSAHRLFKDPGVNSREELASLEHVEHVKLLACVSVVHVAYLYVGHNDVCVCPVRENIHQWHDVGTSTSPPHRRHFELAP
eukprot:48267-Eustigmatos_ZCMA.PRE.1